MQVSLPKSHPFSASHTGETIVGRNKHEIQKAGTDSWECCSIPDSTCLIPYVSAYRTMWTVTSQTPSMCGALDGRRFSRCIRAQQMLSFRTEWSAHSEVIE